MAFVNWGGRAASSCEQPGLSSKTGSKPRAEYREGRGPADDDGYNTNDNKSDQNLINVSEPSHPFQF